MLSMLYYTQQILDREMIRRENVGEELIGVSTRKKREVALGDLRKVKTLGTGTFGRVKLVQHKETKEVFALKCMMKAQVKC
jgi:serine/threonine protein kinase